MSRTFLRFVASGPIMVETELESEVSIFLIELDPLSATTMSSPS